MENVVFNNLPTCYYWQNYQGKEIDFVVRDKEVNNQLIQVSFVSHQSEIKDREIDNLILGSRVLDCNNLILVTWNLQSSLTINNTTVNLIPLSQFLLTKPNLTPFTLTNIKL